MKALTGQKVVMFIFCEQIGEKEVVRSSLPLRAAVMFVLDRVKEPETFLLRAERGFET